MAEEHCDDCDTPTDIGDSGDTNDGEAGKDNTLLCHNMEAMEGTKRKLDRSGIHTDNSHFIGDVASKDRSTVLKATDNISESNKAKLSEVRDELQLIESNTCAPEKLVETEKENPSEGKEELKENKIELEELEANEERSTVLKSFYNISENYKTQVSEVRDKLELIENNSCAPERPVKRESIHSEQVKPSEEKEEVKEKKIELEGLEADQMTSTVLKHIDDISENNEVKLVELRDKLELIENNACAPEEFVKTESIHSEQEKEVVKEKEIKMGGLEADKIISTVLKPIDDISEKNAMKLVEVREKLELIENNTCAPEKHVKSESIYSVQVKPSEEKEEVKEEKIKLEDLEADEERSTVLKPVNNISENSKVKLIDVKDTVTSESVHSKRKNPSEDKEEIKEKKTKREGFEADEERSTVLKPMDNISENNAAKLVEARDTVKTESVHSKRKNPSEDKEEIKEKKMKREGFEADEERSTVLKPMDNISENNAAKLVEARDTVKTESVHSKRTNPSEDKEEVREKKMKLEGFVADEERSTVLKPMDNISENSTAKLVEARDTVKTESVHSKRKNPSEDKEEVREKKMKLEGFVADEERSTVLKPMDNISENNTAKLVEARDTVKTESVHSKCKNPSEDKEEVKENKIKLKGVEADQKRSAVLKPIDNISQNDEAKLSEVRDELQLIESNLRSSQKLVKSESIHSKQRKLSEDKENVEENKIIRDEPEAGKRKIEDFVSEDAQENDDNNNPEWAFLKLLESDEERYKAVRKRWRSLVIPNPNRNLTYIHVKMSSRKILTQRSQNPRKRTVTFEPLREKDRPAKRSRTMSCTTSYDLKVERMNQAIEDTMKELLEKQRHAIGYAQFRFKREKFKLMKSRLWDHDVWEFNRRRNQINEQLDKAVRDAQYEYHDAIRSVKTKKQTQLRVLEESAKEVEQFHRFYRKLDANSTDCFFLSPEEEVDVLEADDFYNAMETFYG